MHFLSAPKYYLKSKLSLKIVTKKKIIAYDAEHPHPTGALGQRPARGIARLRKRMGSTGVPRGEHDNLTSDEYQRKEIGSKSIERKERERVSEDAGAAGEGRGEVRGGQRSASHPS